MASVQVLKLFRKIDNRFDVGLYGIQEDGRKFIVYSVNVDRKDLTDNINRTLQGVDEDEKAEKQRRQSSFNGK